MAEDGLAELQRELETAQRTRERHAQLLKLAERRVALLTELHKVQTSLVRMADELAEAEERGDENRLVDMESEFFAAEMRVERLRLVHEIIDRRSELVELTSEIPQSARTLRNEAEQLKAAIGEYERLSSQLFAAIQEDREAQIGEFEESLGRLEADYELKRDTLRLKLELTHAREEGDPEWIEELEAELRELGSISAVLEQPGRRVSTASFAPPVELTAEQLTAAADQPFETAIVPLLKQSCGACHSDESASGDLNFDALVQQQPLVVNRDRWKNVIQQLTIRSMPPADADAIAEEDRVLLTAWLTQAIDGFDYDSIRQPGYEMTRRLTHEEYNNTVRDLLGADLRPADHFPADMTASSGFENSANSLFMQPVLLERYLGAAERVVDHRLPLSGLTDPSSAWPQLLQDADVTTEAGLREVLERFVTRAFRRPPESAEVAGYVQHVQQSQAAGSSVHAALRDVIQVVLVSPSFLMKAESDTLPTNDRPDAGSESVGPRQISDWELASRLSYFLWSSMPDERLFGLAKGGTLHQPEVLHGEVRRMLQDDRSRTLGTQFAAQWLGFDGMDRLPRSPIDNPWQTDSLIAAMKAESATLFHHLVTANQPIERLVDADFTFVNQELAQHYGMRGVRGEQLRRVSLSDSPRRGVLGHGSILAVTSFPGRTSPVMRGNWILSQLLGTPPPPPPPNVSELDERVADNDRLSARQKLELHRSHPNCYTCHSQIDPLGFAMESFEWYGRHRPRRRDTAASFPGGASFQGLRGLADTLVVERIDDLSEQVTRRMLAYALGRQLEYFDEATVRDVLADFEQEQRRLPALIQAIVRSDAFQQKQRPTQTLTGKGISHVR